MVREPTKAPSGSSWRFGETGAQFIARDFKERVRNLGMTHVRTSPGYPQSNGKLERWRGTIKSECIRPGTPLAGWPRAVARPELPRIRTCTH